VNSTHVPDDDNQGANYHFLYYISRCRTQLFHSRVSGSNVYYEGAIYLWNIIDRQL